MAKPIHGRLASQAGAGSAGRTRGSCGRERRGQGRGRRMLTSCPATAEPSGLHGALEVL